MRILRIYGLTIACALSSIAAPITITYTSVGSGSIGSTPFTNDSFTITELLDTTARVPLTNGSIGFSINDESASIAIAGVGDFTFTTPTRSFVNNTVDTEGYSRLVGGGGDLLYAPANPVFLTGHDCVNWTIHGAGRPPAMVECTGTNDWRYPCFQQRDSDRYLPGGCRSGARAGFYGTCWTRADGLRFACTYE
jgi:hypothetical protein